MRNENEKELQRNKPLDMLTFINQYQGMVFLLAHRVANKFRYKISEADLTQEGFLLLVILYQSDTIDWTNPGLTSFLWKKLEGKMKNVALKRVKRRDTVISLAEMGDNTDTVADDIDTRLSYYNDPATDTRCEQRALLKDVHHYLDSLTSEERFIFVSYKTDGKPFEEIGELLGFSRETARRKFRKVEAGMYLFLEKSGWTINDLEGVR